MPLHRDQVEGVPEDDRISRPVPAERHDDRECDPRHRATYAGDANVGGAHVRDAQPSGAENGVRDSHRMYALRVAIRLWSG